MDTTFIGWLNERMQENGYSPADLAKLSGISKQAISNYLNEQRKPEAEQIVLLAKVFNLPAEDLFRIAGILPPSNKEAVPEKLKQIYELGKNASDVALDIALSTLKTAIKNGL